MCSTSTVYKYNTLHGFNFFSTAHRDGGAFCWVFFILLRIRCDEKKKSLLTLPLKSYSSFLHLMCFSYLLTRDNTENLMRTKNTRAHMHTLRYKEIWRSWYGARVEDQIEIYLRFHCHCCCRYHCHWQWPPWPLMQCIWLCRNQKTGTRTSHHGSQSRPWNISDSCIRGTAIGIDGRKWQRIAPFGKWSNASSTKCIFDILDPWPRSYSRST